MRPISHGRKTIEDMQVPVKPSEDMYIQPSMPGTQQMCSNHELV